VSKHSLLIFPIVVAVLIGCHKNNPPVIEEILASSDSIGGGMGSNLYIIHWHVIE